MTTYQIGLALLMLAVTTDYQGIAVIRQDSIALLGLVVGLGLAGTGLAYVLYYYIVQQLGALKASGVTYIPPVVALAIGTLLIQEPLHRVDMIAMTLILIGVYSLQKGKAKAVVNCPATRCSV